MNTTPDASLLRKTLRGADAVRVIIGGYAAAMFVWEMLHTAALPGFLLANDLALVGRTRLAVALLGGMGIALLLWLALGWLRTAATRPAEPRQRAPDRAFQATARWIFLAALLPFLPILRMALSSAQQIPREFVWGIVLALAAVAFVAIRDLVSLRVRRISAASPAEEPPINAERRLSHTGATAKAHRAGLVVTLLLALGYALFMSVLTIARHNSFMTHAFDLGIHDQAIFNILHSGYMRSTLYGPYAIDTIGDHFSPILYALAPLYALGGDARLLLALQSLFLAAGAIPVYLLAANKTRSPLVGSVLAASYLLYPALHGVNLNDFHQIALVVALLLTALYFLETGRDVAFLVALGLALLVKEEVSLTVAALGGYVFLAKRRYRLGAALVGAGLIYFAVVVGWLMPYLGGKPQIDTRFGGMMAPGAQGASGVAWTLFTNPIYTALTVLGNQQKLVFIGQILAPVLFLPFFAPGLAWIPALPALAILLLTSAHTQYDIAYHYSAHLIPSIFFLSALGLQQVLRRRFGPMPPRFLALALCVASLALSYQYGRLLPKRGNEIPAPGPHAAAIASLLAHVPADASVSAMSDIVPHLTTRRTIYLFPDVADAEYLLLDTAPQANFWPHEGLKGRSKAIRDMLPHIQSGAFGLVRQADGALLLKRGLTPPRTDEALTAIFSARYEAEDLFGDLADTSVADAEASGGKARVASPAMRRADGKAGLVFGPYTDLPPGKFRVEYRLKTDTAPRDERLATLDVFTFRDGGLPRAAREIRGTEFGAVNQYQTFDLEFESDQSLEDVEFRVQYAGRGTLWLDYIYITPVELWLK